MFHVKHFGGKVQKWQKLLPLQIKGQRWKNNYRIKFSGFPGEAKQKILLLDFDPQGNAGKRIRRERCGEKYL